MSRAVPMPDDAVKAAAEALNEGLPGGLLLDEGPAWRAAKRALNAAAPHIRATEREACARLAEQHKAIWLELVTSDGVGTWEIRDAADLIRARTTP